MEGAVVSDEAHCVADEVLGEVFFKEAGRNAGVSVTEEAVVSDEAHCVPNEVSGVVSGAHIVSSVEEANVSRMREFKHVGDVSCAASRPNGGGDVKEEDARSNHLVSEALDGVSVDSGCNGGGNGATDNRLLKEVCSDLSGGGCGSIDGSVVRKRGLASDQTKEPGETRDLDLEHKENLQGSSCLSNNHCSDEHSIDVSGAGCGSHGRTAKGGALYPGTRDMKVESDGRSLTITSTGHSKHSLNELPIAISRLDSGSQGGANAKGCPVTVGMRHRIENNIHDGKRDGFSRGFSKVRYTHRSSGSHKTPVGKSNGIATGEQTRVDASRHSVGIEEIARGDERSGVMKLEESDLVEGTMREGRAGDSAQENGAVFNDSKEKWTRGEIRQENGSMSLSGMNGSVGVHGTEGSLFEETGVDASLGALDARKVGERAPESKLNVYPRKKKSSAEKVRPLDGYPNTRQLSADSALGAERAHDSKRDGYITSRLFAKPLAGRDNFLSNFSTPSPDVRVQADSHGGSMGSFEIRFDDVGDAQGWNNVFPRGQKPDPRYFHAAAVVGRKMVVAGGDTLSGPSNDVKMLHLGRMMWSELGGGGASVNGQVGISKSATPEQLPSCRGHSLISWGKTVLLVGGELNPASDRIEVWSFDLETECWTRITAKGEVPAARSGQSVTRAGSILIMFGGENAKGHKLNDLHILDLKSLMWLPLHTAGAGPSPRARHCAAMYDDRFLLIFGGASKSKPLNDVFALDFETMEWSKMKTKGTTPSPRSGHAGVLVGDKWYIAGGENRGVGMTETLMLDVGKLTWSVVATTTPNTAVANQGLSLVLVQRKEKTMLVAFGGKGSELSNQVQVLYIMPLDHVKAISPPDGGGVEMNDLQQNGAAPFSTLTGAGLPCACVDVAKAHLSPVVEQQSGLRYSPGNSPSTEHSADTTPGLVPLRKRYAVVQEGSKYSSVRQQPEDILSRVLRETSSHESSPSRHLKATDSLHQDLEIRFSDMEAGSRLAPIATNSSKHTRRSGGSSRRKESFDSNLSSVLESTEYVESSRRGAFDVDMNTRSRRPHASDRYEGHYASAGRPTWEGEECTESQLLADLQDAMTMERRIHLINKYRQSYEMKLAAALRKGELTEGHLTAAIRGKEEAEKSLAAALKSRQKAEGKLAAAVKLQMELKERVVAAEQAQEDSNNLCNVVHSENLRLEHDLAFLKAVLEDTQKELHSTRGVLATERARSFQLQMEVFDLKKKLPGTTSTTEAPESTSSAQLTPSTVPAQA